MLTVRTDWGDFPNSIIVHSSGTMANHAEYWAAKAGDINAAIQIANAYLNQDSLKKIEVALSCVDPSAIVVAVHAEESEGRNKLPVAFSLLLEHNLGLKIDTEIVQAVRAFRTGSDGYYRLVKRSLLKVLLLQVQIISLSMMLLLKVAHWQI